MFMKLHSINKNELNNRIGAFFMSLFLESKNKTQLLKNYIHRPYQVSQTHCQNIKTESITAKSQC